MNVGQRIAFLRERRGLSQAALADKLNLSQSSVAMWESGQRGMKGDTLTLLADFFGVSSDYLLGRTDITDYGMIEVNTEELVNIPIVGTIKCGGGQIAYEDISGFSAYPTADIRSGKEYIALIVKGDSMIGDGINEGDIALIEKDAELIQNKIYAVVLDGEEATLKHVIKADGTVVLQPSNPRYPARILAGEELQNLYIVGRLVNTKRNY